MSKGFLIFAQNTKDTNYVQQAYALALSIKNSQKYVTNVSLVTNDKVLKKYQKVFDHIIEIPWVNTEEVTRYRGEHRWKLYHVTPYDETIVLDSDMLILEDISQWWDYCGNYNLKFCSRIKNYKLEVIPDTTNVYRKTFIANNLPSPYYALHYFKKCQETHDFYKILEFVCNNWQWCYDRFALKEYQDCLSMDLATAIAIEIFGVNETVIDKCSPLEFIHLKPGIQGWPMLFESWQDAVPCAFNSRGELVIGNIKQSKIAHYIENSFLTSQMIKKLEGLVHGKEKAS